MAAIALPKGEWLCFLLDAPRGRVKGRLFWEGIGKICTTKSDLPKVISRYGNKIPGDEEEWTRPKRAGKLCLLAGALSLQIFAVVTGGWLVNHTRAALLLKPLVDDNLKRIVVDKSPIHS